MSSAYSSSLERSEGLERYPSGLPSLRNVAAAHEAFCMAFGEASESARRLLVWTTRSPGTGSTLYSGNSSPFGDS